MKKPNISKFATRLVNAGLGCLLTAPAFAATTGVTLAKLDQTMSNISAALTNIGSATVSVAIIWAGYKMVFQHSKWSEISNLVIGAMLVGGATSISGWLMGTTT